MLLALGGLASRSAALPFHMWCPIPTKAASTPSWPWLSVAPKAAGFVDHLPAYLEGHGRVARALLVPVAAGLATVTIIGGNLNGDPAARTSSGPGLLRGGPHRLHADRVRRRLGQRGRHDALLPGGLSLLETWAPFLVVEAVAQAGKGSESIAAYRGLAQRSPILALCMLLFLLSLGGIPFRSRVLGKLTSSGRRREQGFTG